ncbi:MAG TPA: hypothetical protein VIM65_07665 [Cyclobacteriaceae bacterium]
MRSIVVYILLLAHINSCIFIAQEEVDRFDSNGMPVDDINSVFEYFDQIVLGHADPTPEDEDHDSSQILHSVKFSYFAYRDVIIIKKPFLISVAKRKIPNTREECISLISLDVPSPPPKA